MNIAALTFLKIFPLLKVKYQTDSRNWAFVLEYGGYLRLSRKNGTSLLNLLQSMRLISFVRKTFWKSFKESYFQVPGRTPDNPLRIWSAACSSGEEPYTLAILIEESGLFEAGAVEIIGSDIDKKVLEKARKGLYNKKSFSFRTMPKEILEKYFVSFGDEYRVKDSIRPWLIFS